MRSRRTRCLLVFFAAMLIASNAVASARACIVHVAAPASSASRMLDAGDDGQPCAGPIEATNCPAHLTQVSQSSDSNLFFHAPTLALAPPPGLHRLVAPTAPRRLVVASAPPNVGPPLTILFHNLRN